MRNQFYKISVDPDSVTVHYRNRPDKLSPIVVRSVKLVLPADPNEMPSVYYSEQEGFESVCLRYDLETHQLQCNNPEFPEFLRIILESPEEITRMVNNAMEQFGRLLRSN